MHERGKLIRAERSSSEKQESEWVYGERHPIKMRRSRVAKRGISNKIIKYLPVVMRLGDTPVPIPNTMVKT